MTKYGGPVEGLGETGGGPEAVALSQVLDLRQTEYFRVMKGSREWGQGRAIEKPGGWAGGPHLPGIQWGRKLPPQPQKGDKGLRWSLQSGYHACIRC